MGRNKFEIVFEDSQGNPLDAENMVFRFIYRDEAGPVLYNIAEWR